MKTGKPFADLARLVSGMGLTNDSRWGVPDPNSRSQVPGCRCWVLGAGWVRSRQREASKRISNSNSNSNNGNGSSSKVDQPLRSGCEMGAMHSRAGWTGQTGHDMHASMQVPSTYVQ